MRATAKSSDAKSMEIELSAPDAKEVLLAGTFNHWIGTPMSKRKDGVWTTTIQPPNGRHEFKFLIDRKWTCRPGCDDGAHSDCPECARNAFGTMNRVVEIP